MKHPGRRGCAIAASLVIIGTIAGCGGAATTPSPAASATASAAASASASAAAFDLAKIEDSVAYIQTQGTFVTAAGAREEVYSGSGFVVDAAGLVVTNNHVVTGGAFWKVQIGKDKTLYDAQVLGVSECSDLALLKVTGATTLAALEMATAAPTVGEPVYVAGHPNGETYTLTNGIVAKPVAASETSWASVKQEFQYTAQTFPGSSGSPVVDAKGRVLGIHYAGGTPGGPIAGTSFAIASSEAQSIIGQLRTGNLDYIGINGEVNESRTGIAIVSVAPGSPADKAGIQAGDLLVNLNGTATGTDGTKATYCSVLRSHKSTDTLTVVVTRAGQTLNGEINGRPLVASAGPSATSGTSAAIDKLEPYVPSAIWSTCEHSSFAPYPTITQTAVCSASGVDGIWYDLYGTAAELQTAFETDVKAAGATESEAFETDCKSKNVDGTWWMTFADGTKVGGTEGYGLLCYKDDKDNAWIEQADPSARVMFSVELMSGDQATLLDWWDKNDTILVTKP